MALNLPPEFDVCGFGRKIRPSRCASCLFSFSGFGDVLLPGLVVSLLHNKLCQLELGDYL